MLLHSNEKQGIRYNGARCKLILIDRGIIHTEVFNFFFLLRATALHSNNILLTVAPSQERNDWPHKIPYSKIERS